jgi:hypothetical protein
MRTTGLVLLVLQFALATCYGEIRVNVRDKSAKASPVQVSGVLSFDDDPTRRIRYSFQVDGHLYNNSGKDVVLIILHFSGRGALAAAVNLTYQKEYFFGLDPLEKGESEPFRTSRFSLGAATVNGQPIPEREDKRRGAPGASAEIVFVQFTDGTTWGDSDSARDAFVEREQTLQELTTLEKILGDQGEQALKDELSKGDPPPCISSLRASCIGKAESCLGNGLRSMMEAAEYHQHMMNVKSTTFVDKLR